MELGGTHTEWPLGAISLALLPLVALTQPKVLQLLCFSLAILCLGVDAVVEGTHTL